MAIVTPYDWLIVLNLTCLPIQAFMHDIPENYEVQQKADAQHIAFVICLL